jgi:VWFA-related protein
VPVRVLYPDGRPVRGLKKEDFVIYDNGQRQVITEFEIHEPKGFSSPPDSGARAREALQEVNLKYFFVLDMQGSDRVGNTNAKIAVRTFASAYLRPGDEVCLLTFGSLTGLVLRQYLTTDLDVINKAIDQSIEMGSVAGMPQIDVIEVPADDVRGSGGRGEAVLNSVSSEGGASTSIVVPGIGKFGRSHADFNMSMSELAHALAYIPGSKTVVYFSRRIPDQSVSRLFADANATVFAVNTNSVPPKGGGANGSIHRQQKEEQGRALAEFAEASGGRYFDNVASADAIARDVAELSGHYYVLGYYVHPSWDGRAHQIKVEISTPGLRILAQSSYNDPKPFSQWTDIEKQLHLFDLALSDRPVRTQPLELPLEVLSKPRATEVNTALIAELQMDEKDGLPPGRTEAYIFIYGRDQRLVANWRGELDTASLKSKRLFPYVVTKLQPGRYESRIVFREMETGRSAAVRRQFLVPEPLAAKPGVLICGPPLLLQGGEGEFVRLSKSDGKDRRRESLMSFYPFWPRNCVPLIGRCEHTEIRAILPVCCVQGFQPEEDLAVGLINENDGTVTPVEWRVIDSKVAPDGIVYCLLVLKSIEQDKFQMVFTVLDPLTGAKNSVIISR